MPLRYVINLILIVAVWFVLNSLIQSGVITNYWSGILITVGINIILATSLNVATPKSLRMRKRQLDHAARMRALMKSRQ